MSEKDDVIREEREFSPEEKRRRRMHSVKVQIKQCDRELEALEHERLEGLHGQSFTAAQAADIAEDLEERVRGDVDRGYRKHDPVGRGERLLAMLAPLADFLVFLYFLAVIFNVNWIDPRTTPVETMLALVLSIIATVGVAWALRWFGMHYRQHKPDDGRFHWKDRTRKPAKSSELLLLVGVLVGVSLMMAVRVYTDAYESQAGLVASLLIAVFMAVITLTLNYVIFMVAFSDGSPTTDEIRHLRDHLAPIEAKRRATKQRRDELLGRLEMLRGAPEAEPVPAPVPEAPVAQPVIPVQGEASTTSDYSAPAQAEAEAEAVRHGLSVDDHSTPNNGHRRRSDEAGLDLTGYDARTQ